MTQYKAIAWVNNDRSTENLIKKYGKDNIFIIGDGTRDLTELELSELPSEIINRIDSSTVFIFHSHGDKHTEDGVDYATYSIKPNSDPDSLEIEKKDFELYQLILASINKVWQHPIGPVLHILSCYGGISCTNQSSKLLEIIKDTSLPGSTIYIHAGEDTIIGARINNTIEILPTEDTREIRVRHQFFNQIVSTIPGDCTMVQVQSGREISVISSRVPKNLASFNHQKHNQKLLDDLNQLSTLYSYAPLTGEYWLNDHDYYFKLYEFKALKDINDILYLIHNANRYGFSNDETYRILSAHLTYLIVNFHAFKSQDEFDFTLNYLTQATAELKDSLANLSLNFQNLINAIVKNGYCVRSQKILLFNIIEEAFGLLKNSTESITDKLSFIQSILSIISDSLDKLFCSPEEILEFLCNTILELPQDNEDLKSEAYNIQIILIDYLKTLSTTVTTISPELLNLVLETILRDALAIIMDSNESPQEKNQKLIDYIKYLDSSFCNHKLLPIAYKICAEAMEHLAEANSDIKELKKLLGSFPKIVNAIPDILTKYVDKICDAIASDDIREFDDTLHNILYDFTEAVNARPKIFTKLVGKILDAISNSYISKADKTTAVTTLVISISSNNLKITLPDFERAALSQKLGEIIEQCLDGKYQLQQSNCALLHSLLARSLLNINSQILCNIVSKIIEAIPEVTVNSWACENIINLISILTSNITRFADKAKGFLDGLIIDAIGYILKFNSADASIVSWFTRLMDAIKSYDCKKALDPIIAKLEAISLKENVRVNYDNVEANHSIIRDLTDAIYILARNYYKFSSPPQKLIVSFIDKLLGVISSLDPAQDNSAKLVTIYSSMVIYPLIRIKEPSNQDPQAIDNEKLVSLLVKIMRHHTACYDIVKERLDYPDINSAELTEVLHEACLAYANKDTWYALARKIIKALSSGDYASLDLPIYQALEKISDPALPHKISFDRIIDLTYSITSRYIFMPHQAQNILNKLVIEAKKIILDSMNPCDPQDMTESLIQEILTSKDKIEEDVIVTLLAKLTYNNPYYDKTSIPGEYGQILERVEEYNNTVELHQAKKLITTQQKLLLECSDSIDGVMQLIQATDHPETVSQCLSMLNMIKSKIESGMSLLGAEA